MNLNICGHHLDLTPPLREYVTDKLKRVERHFDHLIDASVILSVDKLQHKAEATLHTRGGNVRLAARTRQRCAHGNVIGIRAREKWTTAHAVKAGARGVDAVD